MSQAKYREPRVRRLKGARGRGTAQNDKVPIVGIIQRNGNLIIEMFPNVQQVTIKPFLLKILRKIRLYILMNITSTVGLLNGDTNTKLYVIVKENMLEMKMVMVFMKCIQIR